MNLTLFKDKNSSFKEMSFSKSVIHVWYFTLTDGFKYQTSITPELKDKLYIGIIKTPDYDCFVLTKQDNSCGIVRVGNPDILLIGYTGIKKQKIKYTQFSLNSNLQLDEGVMIEIDEGFYYIKPKSLVKSFFKIGNIIKTLEVPYKNEAFGSILLEPNRPQMIAIPVKGQRVKEYFLDKIADLIGKPASTVIDVVKSYPSSNASTDKFQVFKPDLSNPLSTDNFKLVQSDNNVDEITPFFVITKDFTGTIKYSWNAADGVN